MLDALDVLNSTLSSTLRFWRGTNALILPTPHGGKRFRPKVEQPGGRQQFPFLVDPNTGESMYESADIIVHLYRRYGRRSAPTRLLRPLDVSSSVLASVPRLGAGKVQVPCLVDPNTDAALFESEAIRKYLLDTYAR